MEQQYYLDRLETDLKLRGRATSTIDAYRKNAARYLGFIDCPIDETDEDDIRAFIECLIEQDYQPSTTNNYLSSILFLYEVTLNRAINRRQTPFMKIKQKPVDVLNREEIASILEKTDRLNRLGAFMLAYSAGLRISEVCRLKTSDIDAGAMLIHVIDSKRGKSRFTILCPVCLKLLRRYWATYKPHSPSGYLFPQRNDPSKPINPKTLQTAFNEVVAACRISKDVSFHTLRVCFATHLLEKGTDIFIIKELLGHASIRTTARYLHLANTTKGITSPLEELFKGGLYV